MHLSTIDLSTCPDTPTAPTDGVPSIVARIARHALVAPQRVAVVDVAGTLTYGDLDRQANQLAAYLLEMGTGPQSCIAIFMERSAEFVIAALAVLKTGAAYLPLDSATPGDRIAFILADSQASVLITHRRKGAALKNGACGVIELDGSDVGQIRTMPATFSEIDVPPQSLAYVVYTSGSTGRPKGVEITHANLLNLIDWHNSAFAVTEADRASQVAGFGFDATAWEIWPHLVAGASLHIADESTRRSAHALCEWLVAERITISFVPTVLAEQLLHANWPAQTALRTLLTGADTLHRRPARGLPFVLVNNYGPTECTVVATSGTVISDHDLGEGKHVQPSIGRPIANATVLILDGEMREVAQGEAGELCLAGALVGRGYRNNPELTASRFVMFTPDSGGPFRIYRTGDRARLLADGEIAFLGRVDDQVKLRGYRIELGEIVAWLDRYPEIDASAVVTRDALPGHGAEAGPQLVAYVVPAAGASITSADLSTFLAARIPDYMIPSCYVKMTSLPLTANGKLDKTALPLPSPENLLAAPTAGNVAPSNAAGGIEGRVADMVAALLKLPAVKRDDNFFMMGGHSMLGVQLAARIRDEFGVKLSLRQLFGAPTVAALSAEVARLKNASAT